MAAAFTSAAVIAVIFALAAMAFYLAAEILAAALFLMEDILALRRALVAATLFF